MPLPPLAQTLLLPLWGRAAYARWFPHRRDALADALLDAVGADRAALQRAMGDYGAVALGRRSAWVLDAARDFVAAHSQAHILNLGAGLDGLLHRLDSVLAHSISVDLPEVIALRAAHLPANPGEVAIAADLLGDTPPRRGRRRVSGAPSATLRGGPQDCGLREVRDDDRGERHEAGHQRRRRVGVEERAPPFAIITGSRTMGGRWGRPSRKSATASIRGASSTMPILMACTGRLSKTERSWAFTNSGGTRFTP
jgi:hypothetical protein